MEYGLFRSVVLVLGGFILSTFIGCSSSQPPLHTAILQNDKEAIQNLITKPENIHSVNMRGETPFQLAVRKGQVQTMEMLFHAGADINEKDLFSISPIIDACRYGQYDAAFWLIEHHCDLESCTNAGMNVIYMASLYRQMDILELLLKQDNIDVNKVSNSGFSPLSAACSNTYDDYCKVVKDADNKPLSKEDYDQRQVPVMQLLIGHGAIVNRSNDHGDMPIHMLVIGKSSTASLNMLIEQGAKIDASNNKGCLPIHVAALVDDTNAFEYLFEKGSPHPEHCVSHEIAGKTDLFMARLCKKNSSAEIKDYYLKAHRHFESEIEWDNSEIQRIKNQISDIKMKKFVHDLAMITLAAAASTRTTSYIYIPGTLNLQQLEEKEKKFDDTRIKCEAYIKECAVNEI